MKQYGFMKVMLLFSAGYKQAHRPWRLSQDDPGVAALRFSVLFSWNVGSEKSLAAVGCLLDWIIMVI